MAGGQPRQNFEEPPGFLEPGRQVEYHSEELEEPFSVDGYGAVKQSLLGMLTPIPSGYLICAIIAVEGAFLVFDLNDPFGGATTSMTGVTRHNPWYSMQWLLLEVLSLGDLVAAGVGAVGLWLATHSLPLMLGKLQRWDAVLSLSLVGALVAWRVLVTLAVVPWVGFMIAFEPAEYVRWTRILGAVIYLLFNLFLTVLLFSVFRAASDSNEHLQAERQQLLQRAEELKGDRASRKEVVLVGGLPLEGTVGLYILAVFTISLLLLWKVLSTKNSGAGWAFFSRFAQGATDTYIIEILAYVLSASFAFLAGCAVIVHRIMEGQHDKNTALLAKRCTALVLAFSLASLLRFAFFVPITGMALVSGNICGLYVRLMAALSLESRLAQGAALHCTVGDTATVGLMLIVLFVDAYFIRGVLQLWQRYRARGAKALSSGEQVNCGATADPMMAYGSAAIAQGR